MQIALGVRSSEAAHPPSGPPLQPAAAWTQAQGSRGLSQGPARHGGEEAVGSVGQLIKTSPVFLLGAMS